MGTIRLLFGLVLVMSCSSGFAEAIYRWVDDSGKVHYSQSKPLDYQYTVIEAPPSPPANSPDSNKPFAEQINARSRSGAGAPAGKTAAPEKNDAQCDTARDNLLKLQSNARVGYTDEAGETVYLDDEARDTKIEETRKHIEYFCNN